jgi:hypothetical protein
MKYQKQEIEAYLREYTTLQVCVVYGYDDDLSVAKIDLDNAIRKLQKSSPNLYKTIMGVFVYGNPIQEQAKQMDVSKRQISRRLDDGVHMLTMIMNGEVL